MDKNKMPKFSRVSNFSTFEEELLISLVKKHQHVIECKGTDICTPREKNTAWEALAKEFNCTSGQQFRSLEVIKRKYENIKKRTKKKYAEEKIKVRGTGGGPYEAVTTTAIDIDVREILGASLTGFDSKFDDDVQLLDMIVIEDPIENLNMDLPTEAQTVQQPSTSTGGNAIADGAKDNNGDWSHYTPKMLKAKKSDLLQHKTPYSRPKENKPDKTGKVLENKLVAWSNGKLELVEFQKQMFLEEQKLKLEQMKEKHQKALEREERESQERIQAIREEHRIKMEILELQKAKYL